MIDIFGDDNGALLTVASECDVLAKKPYRLESPTPGYDIVEAAVLLGGTSL